MSIYLIAVERGLHHRSPFTLMALRNIEKYACRLPDLLILDTEEYVAWFSETHHVPKSRFKLVPTGADDRIFKPLQTGYNTSSEFKVVYYGSFIPNHGVLYIVEAARLLSSNSQIRFELIGDGPERRFAEDAAKRYGLTNITFLDWMEKDALVKHVSRADICLGVFGETPQSMMTVQNKIYECMAMAKPVITGDSPAVRRQFLDDVHIYVCKRADPEDLARSISDLRENHDKLGVLSNQGHRSYIEGYTPQKLGMKVYMYLVSLQKSD